MTHGPCFTARGALWEQSSKLSARDKPKNVESKHYWRFYAMSAELYDNVFQNIES